MSQLQLQLQLPVERDAAPLLPPNQDESNSQHESPLGPVYKRLIPALMPREGHGGFQAYFLRCGETGRGGRGVFVVAEAAWRQDGEGRMRDLQLRRYRGGEARLVG